MRASRSARARRPVGRDIGKFGPPVHTGRWAVEFIPIRTCAAPLRCLHGGPRPRQGAHLTLTLDQYVNRIRTPAVPTAVRLALAAAADVEGSLRSRVQAVLLLPPFGRIARMFG